MKQIKPMEMIKRMFTPLSVILILGALSVAISIYSKLTENDDNIVEETIEDLVEREAEAVFFLEEGKLKGKIDLTPGSKEK